MNIMYIGRNSVLHIIDEVTRFSCASFLGLISTTLVWDAIITSLSSVYSGMLNTIIIDQSSQFRNNFVDIVAMNDINAQKIEIEAYNSVASAERYHAPLHNTYMNLKQEHLRATRHMFIRMTVKAINDTLYPEDIVLLELISG